MVDKLVDKLVDRQTDKQIFLFISATLSNEAVHQGEKPVHGQYHHDETADLLVWDVGQAVVHPQFSHILMQFWTLESVYAQVFMNMCV